MTSDTDPNSFRPLNIEFLVKGTGDSFDIFLQSDSEIIVKFTSTDPKH